jgi:hypothetical protein
MPDDNEGCKNGKSSLPCTEFDRESRPASVPKRVSNGLADFRECGRDRRCPRSSCVSHGRCSTRNLALVPEDERDEWRDKLLRDLCGRRLFGVVPLGTSREAADMFQWIFDFVALRKEALYPQVDHFIASFETEYTESGLRVNVMYTLDHPTVERID